MKLPVVQHEILFAQREDMHEIGMEKYVRDILARLQVEQPSLGQFVATFASLGQNSQHSAVCALLIYRMLEKQAEADEFNILLPKGVS